ncbi:MAG: class I SAM-dependent methyltransferase, partial [Planctomycetota bacterium]
VNTKSSWLRSVLSPRYSIASLLLYSVVVAALLIALLLVWQRQIIASVLDTRLPQVRIAEEHLLDDADAYQREYEFTENWFTWNIPVWERVLASYKGQADLCYLEVGSHEGRSLVWMFENVLTDPTARATAVDIFDGPFKDRFFANIERAQAVDRVNAITGFSQLVLRDLPLDSFDIIYIDGSHMEDDVLEDAVLSWRLLKDGGVLIFDDYRWFGSSESEIEGLPKMAIDAFVACFGERVEVIHNSYQLILRKRA